MKRLIPLIAVAVVIWIIYQKSPGLQSQANELKNKWTEWTEEAIKDNPVGFLEAREKNLNAVLEELKTNKGKIDEEVAKLQGAHDEHKNKVETAERLANEFKVAYKAAKDGGTWPITLAGKEYTEAQVVEQVQRLMVDKGTHSTIVEDRAKQIERIAESQTKIEEQITKVTGSLEGIKANREKIKADQAIAKSEQWLKEIEDQINANDATIATQAEDSVRTLEEITAYEAAEKEKEAKAAAEAAKEQAARDFLDS